MSIQSPGETTLGFAMPCSQRVLPVCGSTKRQDDVTGSSVKKVNVGAEANRKTHMNRSLHAGDYDNVPITRHRQMAGLACVVGYLLHQRTRNRKQLLQWLMLVRYFEQLE